MSRVFPAQGLRFPLSCPVYGIRNRLHRLLGKGSFAEVYLAEHLYLNISAAIKVLQTTLDEEGQDHLVSTSNAVGAWVK